MGGGGGGVGPHVGCRLLSCATCTCSAQLFSARNNNGID